MSSKRKKDKPTKGGKLLDFDAKYTPSCYAGHPGMALPGGMVFGGSAHTPVVKNADIYVALEASARFNLSDPWEAHQITNVRFSIADSYPPKDSEVPRFKKMVTYLCNQVQAGKKVHVGCIGGHGRTGLVLAAMAAELGHKDAIQYVRKNYCSKAVESSEQVDFLMKHYGVNYANANKSYVSTLSDGLWSDKKSGKWTPPLTSTAKAVTKALAAPASTGSRQISPMANAARSLWKPHKA